MNRPAKIAIVAHLPHYNNNNKWFAFEPYVREIEIWASLFGHVTIFTDVHKKKPSFSLGELPANCIVKPIYLKSGPGLINNLIRLFQLPIVFFQISFVYFKFSIIHTRTSGFPTIYVNLLNLLFNKPTIEKWATNYPPDKSLGILSKVNAWILYYSRSKTKVLVYRDIQKRSFVRFIPALFGNAELLKYQSEIDKIKWIRKANDWIYVCVARLHPDKNLSLLIEGINNLVNGRVDFKGFKLQIIGEGPERESLTSKIVEYNLEKNIKLLGAKSYSEVISILQKSNFLIMPGINEGWPKVINEALACECVPIVVRGGNAERVMQFMDNPGLLFNPNPECLSESIENSQRMEMHQLLQMIENGSNSNQKMTLEEFKMKLEGVINEVIA